MIKLKSDSDKKLTGFMETSDLHTNIQKSSKVVIKLELVTKTQAICNKVYANPHSAALLQWFVQT